MSPAEELRQAAAKVRCDHEFPWTTRLGIRRRADECSRCDASWERRDMVATELAEHLATWLEHEAKQSDVCSDEALSVARALNA